jgi:flagellar biosynthesis GTPase FlhF
MIAENQKKKALMNKRSPQQLLQSRPRENSYLNKDLEDEQ